ncbi:GTP cyclohydrolase I FolE [Clostridium tyrobutyricum]|uniref:GTP cyclohydrolase 1 n=1 Tax=Clostridium tyrobutyricum DIVETGP TaxID=1408889 RepID=W6N4S3_CLOTY|nr:GTP cyclohydrolase I FolE [Clostridium tyrobutyricum]CDL91020.1 GTP cyclohydrolase I type 1 [Clostridium tyrobutyricum DIVETGP]AND84420.1 GTP cyclohydrolase 1 [Clostridium tyrobutyricum]ANP69038.1 GTP cyclohydrolase I FolE [Clostridium tyrobutyricum]QCH27891.1 GTP cyclohydrolase 1 [Clostridium tyrobutyricum]QNB66609.1 GTP cyclohydrolase I FolE [Clostridium tyrobutyricum]
MIDETKIKKAVRMIIEAIGENPDREGLLQTPDRIARMYKEVFKGLNQDPEKHLSKMFTLESDDIVLEKDIIFYSMCEHHFLPFYGKAHIAYISSGKVVGLSKLARTVEVFAKRPQLQERMTRQIADAIFKYLNAKGVMVIVEAEHMCMTMRGIKKPGSKTVTAVTLGTFNGDPKLIDQVYSMINMGK